MDYETAAKTVINFGKHKGLTLRQVPLPYLEWCYENNVGWSLLEAIAMYIARPFVPYVNAKGPKRPLVDAKPAKPKPPSQPVLGDKLDCSDRFDPTHDWSGRQEWDGESAPWEDQATQIDSEFRAMFD